MSINVTSDVTIVGYGPTGQVLALLLGRMGHSVTVIDRWPDLYPLPRAVHVDHEVMRILQAVGVMEDVLPITETIDRYQWVNAARQLLVDFDFSGIGASGWPVSNMVSQPELERVLDRHVKALPNVTLYQGWSANSLSAQSDHVELEIERGEWVDGRWKGSEERKVIQSRWLVGADGANSFVRQALSPEKHDLGFAYDWLVVDVIPDEDRKWNPQAWQLCDPARPTSVVPGGPGRRRWEFMVLPGERTADMNRAEVAWKLLAPWDITPSNAKLERHAVYTFRGQWVLEWRRGRVLLAGDAAHLMPPFLGQGLCSGVRDSIALAWRLDAVLRSKMSENVLDSYGSERSSHVQEIIGQAVELGKVICIADTATAAQRDQNMLAAMSQPDRAPSPPPQPRLGPGLWSAEAPGAGLLSLQAEVVLDGKRGRFDDLVGVRFVVMARNTETLAAISQANRAALDSVNAALVHFGANGLVDVNGAYGAWFNQLDCVAVFARPDFYLQGGARDAVELNDLLDSWRQAIN